ncbi:outer membrane adhesin like protein [Rhodopirellula sallentina SM41]|uniref:Outer membrane adhesin like protein n=1 Tax=Rhodopirellula sallentina SM41 TaxID=1263870 RepID=M5U967_9BACT|nr:outer membrane adhesin like protein [Rhodopirellula sallentina SM41]
MTVQVEDGTNTSSTETIEITINDVNDNAPVVEASQTFNVSEDAANSFSLGSVSATDDDSVGAITNWSIVSGNGDGVFAINATTGELTVADNSNLNFESASTYTLGITVEDGTNTSATQTISVSVGDINEAPSVSLTPVVTTIDENTDTSAPIVVATITIDDDDLGSESVTLDGADAGAFEIVGNDLRLRAGTDLDFETKSSFDVTVTVDDATLGGTPDDSAAFTLTVADVNDPATGNAVISGSLIDGETLSVDASSISDEDGLNPFAYQWTRDGVNIAGANATTYVLTTDDIGSAIRVAVTYTDGGGNAESILSSPTGVVVAANIAPTLTNYETTGTSNVAKVVPASVFESLSGDADGDALTAMLVTPPASGNLVLLPSGEFTFTPEAGFIGEVTFEWKANDGASDSNVATVTIEFAPVLPPPSATAVTTTQTDSGTDNGDNNNSNEEPAETESESESDSSESENSSEEEKSSESSEGDSVDPVQSGMRGESQSESRSSESTQAVNAVEVAIEGQADGQSKQATTSDALIKQLSESFSEHITGSSREAAMQASDSSTPLSDYQTRSLVMADFALMTRPGAMWDQLDNYQKDVDSRIHGDLIMVGSAGAAASSFTVGVVAWALRSGFLVSGLIAHMPAWSGVDPLLIMNGLTGSAGAGAAGSETLEQLMDRQNREVTQSPDADSSDVPDNA